MNIYIRTTLWLIAMAVNAVCNFISVLDVSNLTYNDIAKIGTLFLSTIAVNLVALLDMKRQPPDGK